MGQRISFISLGLVLCFTALRASGSEPDPDFVTPISEHDHFLGQVHVLPTGDKAYPDASQGNGYFEIHWRSAKESVRKTVVASAAREEVVSAYPLKSHPTVSWYLHCPEAKSSCYCNDGRHYELLATQSATATAQGFRFEVRTARLDVRDMQITRQDGSTYLAPGKYELSMEINYGGRNHRCTLLSEASTHTGVDVPRGYKYSIITHAVSEEGSTLSSTQEVDFR